MELFTFKNTKGEWGKICPTLFPKVVTQKVILRDPDAILKKFLHSGRGDSDEHQRGAPEGQSPYGERASCDNEIILEKK